MTYIIHTLMRDWWDTKHQAKIDTLRMVTLLIN